jgi:hypothetical protein
VATASDAGSVVRLTLGRVSKANLTVAAYRGTSANDPVADHLAAAETVSRSIHVTPTAPIGSPAVVVSYWAHKDSTTTVLDPPDGVAVRAAGTQTGSGRVTALLADSGAPVTSGSYGGQSATAQGNSSVASMWTIVLAPAE